MKKTLLASAILASLVSVSSQAATIYDQEGTTVAVSGSAEVAINSNDSVDGTAESASSGSIGIEGTSKISDDVTAYASFGVAADVGAKAEDDDILIGFKPSFGDISLGATDAALDQVTDFTDIGDEFGGIQGIVSGGGDTGLFYTNTFSGLTLNAEYIASDTKDEDSMGVSAVYSLGDLNLGLGYVAVDDANEIALAVGYTAGDLTLGLGYAMGEVTEYDIDNDGTADTFTESVDYTSLEIAAKYQVTEALSLAVLAGQTELEDSDGNTADVAGYYAIEAGYAVNDAVYAYVAYQASTLDEDDDSYYSDDQIKASIEYSF